MTTLETDHIQDQLDKPTYTLILVGTETCEYCKLLIPFFDEIKSTYRNANFFFLLTKNATWLWGIADLSMVPVTFLFYEGKLVTWFRGANLDSIKELLGHIE